MRISYGYLFASVLNFSENLWLIVRYNQRAVVGEVVVNGKEDEEKKRLCLYGRSVSVYIYYAFIHSTYLVVKNTSRQNASCIMPVLTLRYQLSSHIMNKRKSVMEMDIERKRRHLQVIRRRRSTSFFNRFVVWHNSRTLESWNFHRKLPRAVCKRTESRFFHISWAELTIFFQPDLWIVYLLLLKKSIPRSMLKGNRMNLWLVYWRGRRRNWSSHITRKRCLHAISKDTAFCSNTLYFYKLGKRRQRSVKMNQ